MQPEQPRPIDIFRAILVACTQWLSEAQTAEHSYVPAGSIGLALNLYLVATGVRAASCIAWPVGTDWCEGAGRYLTPLGLTALESMIKRLSGDSATLYIVKSAAGHTQELAQEPAREPPRTAPEARRLLGPLFPEASPAEQAHTLQWACKGGRTELILWQEPMKAFGAAEHAIIKTELARFQKAFGPLGYTIHAYVDGWDIGS